MKTYALGVQYDGAQYSGFQRQVNAVTIQSELETALSQIAAESIQVVVAGRTDAGVHATQQVVSFCTTSKRECSAWVKGTNSHLPGEIAVIWAKPANDPFHARYSARWRRYCYIYGMRDQQQVFDRGLATWIEDSLQIGRMREAASLFLGEQDFSAVQAAQCSSDSPYRYVYHIDVFSISNFVVIDVAANAFLMNMVRKLVAVLRAVGNGKLTVNDVAELLKSRDRTLAPPTAKAQGLYLTEVGYDLDTGVAVSNIVPSVISSACGRFKPIVLPADYFRREVAA